jgi:hypothetical protein
MRRKNIETRQTHLFGTIGNAGHVCRNLTEGSSILRQAFGHLAQKLVDPALYLVGGEIELACYPQGGVKGGAGSSHDHAGGGGG